MEKEKILKAMKMCSNMYSSPDSCEGCPYNGNDHCDSEMLNDALSLLKANEVSATPKAKYTHIEVYTKNGNLKEYFLGNSKLNTSKESASLRRYYEAEREIQLLAMYRWENGKLFCKIKCPVNPLPTNEEFKAVSRAVVFRFLAANGWEYQRGFYTRMFE